ncbi:MAG: nucleotidyltransferase substrate binding protein [Candidatus Neomarinimicrobiota bacterium]
MSTEDTRWIQRFSHYNKALSQLTKFIEKGNLNELEKQGLIQSFEYTYELAWNTIKDYFEVQGETGIGGSRDAFRLAFRRELIKEGDVWMDMIRSRALTAHTYNEDIAEEIAGNIINRYFNEFIDLRTKLDYLKNEAG